jgi:ankyrin repeat protein
MRDFPVSNEELLACFSPLAGYDGIYSGKAHYNIHVMTAGECAAFHGHKLVAQALVEKLERPTTAMLCFAYMKKPGFNLGNREEIALMLLQHGADINGIVRDGWPAIAYAAVVENEPMLRFLLDNGAEISAAHLDKALMGSQALHFSFLSDDLRIARLLLDRGASVDAATATGETALHVAAHTGHTKAVDLLLSRGVVVNTATDKGETALHYALHIPLDVVHLAASLRLQRAGKDPPSSFRKSW